MGASPIFGIPLIASQQAQPEVTHNEAVMLLSLAFRGVTQVGLNAPPGSPAEGDAYVLGAAPTGAWSGKANKIAIRYNAAWDFLPGNDEDGTNIPIGVTHEGLRVWDRTNNCFYVWSGSAWTPNFLIAKPVTTVAGLAALPAINGLCAIVTDANATTLGSAVAGGGANRVPVNYDSVAVAWIIG